MQTSQITIAAALMNAALAVPAFAQTNSSSEEKVATESDSATIIVTATRRDELAIDVPMSLTAISGEQLTAQDKDDLADYIRQVPGVTFRQQSAGLNELSIRGVSGGGGQRAKAPISFYIDDVPVVSDPVASPDVKTFDINRVEVLRGPQGTLFGESALGGVIRIITNAPNPNKFEGAVKLSYINFAHGGAGYNADAMINIPLLADQLALRVVASRRDEAGWIDNIGVGGRPDANDLDYWSGRAKLLYTPHEGLEISGSYSITRSDYGSRQSANQLYQQVINVTDENRQDDMDQANITVKVDLGGATLTSSSNYFKRITSRLFDLNSFNGFLPATLFALGKAPANFQFTQFAQTLNINDKNYIQEVRIASDSDRSLRWVMGGYYGRNMNFVGVDFFGKPDLGFNYLRLRRNETYNQAAAFGEVEFDVTERLTLIGGLRYTHESRNIHYDQSDDWPMVVFLPADGIFDAKFKYNILTPKFAAKYEIGDHAQIYASATRGFRGPGGNTDYNNSGVRRNIYGAETIWSYELGTKGLYFNNLLSFEAAVYKTDWKDRQEVVNPADPPTAQYVDNIGSARIWGGEVSVALRPLPGVGVGFNYAYTDTKIINSARAASIGRALPGVPKHSGSIFFDGKIPLSDSLSFVAHVDGAYSGATYYSLTNPTGSKAKGYWLANLSAGIEAGNWSARVFLRNVTDEFIKYGVGATTSINEPRTFGVTVQTKF